MSLRRHPVSARAHGAGVTVRLVVLILPVTTLSAAPVSGPMYMNALQTTPAGPPLTAPRGYAPVLSAPVMQRRLTSVQQLDEAIDGLHQMSWQLYSMLPDFKDARGRTAAQDVDTWLLRPERAAQIEALRATAQEQSGKGDRKALAATLDSVTQLIEQETYLASALTSYWTLQDLAVRHAVNLRQLAARLSLEPGQPQDPAVEMIAVRVGRDLTQAMSAQSLGEQSTELERLKNGRHDLLHALNDLRTRLAVELSEQDRTQRKAEPLPRAAPCPEPVTRTSGADKPRLAQANQAPESFYPAASRRAEFEGKVTVEAWVSANGCMQKADIYTSSGVADLDDAALRWTQQAKFLPAERDHQPVDGSLLLMIRFQLSADP